MKILEPLLTFLNRNHKSFINKKLICCVKEKIITFEQFLEINPKNAVILKKDKLQKIESLLIKKYKTKSNVGLAIGCSRRFVAKIFYKKQNPSAGLLLRICKEIKIKPKELIEKITPRCRYNYSYLKPKNFPIKLDEILSALVGHALGDGHLRKVFSYTNKDEKLISNMIKLAKKIPIKNLSINHWSHHGESIRFSTLLKDILICTGATIGNKTTTRAITPDWIKNGNLKIKRNFLKALFDDEGTVNILKKEIVFGATKNISFEKNLNNYLNSIKRMLLSLGIKGVTITDAGFNYGKNGKTINKQLRICGQDSFKEFMKKVNFNSPKKRKKLEILLKSYQKHRE